MCEPPGRPASAPPCGAGDPEVKDSLSAERSPSPLSRWQLVREDLKTRSTMAKLSDKPPDVVFKELVRAIDRPHPFDQQSTEYNARVAAQRHVRVSDLNRDGTLKQPPATTSAEGSFQGGSFQSSFQKHLQRGSRGMIEDAKRLGSSVLSGPSQAGPRVSLFASENVPWYLIDPRTSTLLAKWDAITAGALITTALFTPFEIAFLGAPTSYTGIIFLLNRVIDLLFLIDMVLQFFLLLSVSDRYGDRWITDHAELVRRYLRGWFAIDLFSTAVSAIDFVAIAGVQSVVTLKVIRVVRVLRLTRLIRLARSSRLMARFETRYHVDYAVFSLVRIIVTLLLCTHWSACVFTLGASFTRPTPEFTW